MAVADGEWVADPSWWRPIVDEHRATDALQSVWSMSRALADAASTHAAGSHEQRTLMTLAVACVARLRPEDWNDPYEPLFGSKSPAGLTDGQLVVLRRVAAAMDTSDDPLLRGRVSDLCWWYVDRGDRELRDAAVHSYTSVPLDPETWFTDGEAAIQRAVEIAKRLGPDGTQLLDALADVVVARLRAATLTDRFFAVRLSQMARSEGFVPAPDAAGLARLTEKLAVSARRASERDLERAWEEEAAAYHTRAGEPDDAKAALERRALSYAAQADDRRNGVGGAANTASHFVELAIRALQQLPRAYRADRGLDERITQLRGQLDDDRLAILTSMAVLRSDPVDISEYAAHARAHVSGKEPVAALAALGAIHRPSKYAEAVDQARTSLRENPLSHLLGNEYYSSSGQKLASSAGASSTDDSDGEQVDEATWSAMIRHHSTLTELVVDALIRPALNAVALEQRYTMQDLYDLCTDDPWIPQGHEALWARGLLHGLNGDFPSAVAVLVPQIEHVVHVALKQHGVYTLVADERGVETERGLSWLLDEPAATKVLGPDLLFELKATLTDRQGPNYRNTIAHGLIDDAVLLTRAPIYAWWIALHLLVITGGTSVSHLETQH